jgi:hypothetical protein
MPCRTRQGARELVQGGGRRGQPQLLVVGVDDLPQELRFAVELTPAGAALYRQLAGGWLGPGWEDDLHAYAEQPREEHHYTTATSPDEEFLRHLAERHAQKKTVVRVVPIGPWCIYWWERHPAGCRIEIEVSRL